MESAVREIKGLLEDAGVADAPVGVDIVEPPSCSRCSGRTDRCRRQQLMLDAGRSSRPTRSCS